MLGLLVVQFLAGISLAAIVVGLLVGHGLPHPSGEVVRVTERNTSARWTEIVWVGGALVASFWSIGVLIAPTYAYHWPVTPDFPASDVIQLLGFLISIAGGLLFFAAVKALGRHMTPAIQIQEGHRLVQEGPYRYIRHPAYTAIVTGAGGLSVLYLSPPLALITLLLAGMAMYRAHLEEKLLRSPGAFGNAYNDYVARTGRFLPRIRSRP